MKFWTLIPPIYMLRLLGKSRPVFGSPRMKETSFYFPSKLGELSCIPIIAVSLRDDCIILPIEFATAEELSEYVFTQIVAGLGTIPRERGLTELTVSVSELRVGIPFLGMSPATSVSQVYERPTQCAKYTALLVPRNTI